MSFSIHAASDCTEEFIEIDIAILIGIQFGQQAISFLFGEIAATITEIELFQDSYTAWSDNIDEENTDEVKHNNYTIQFRPINALPAKGSIKLQYPAQISIDKAETKCFVTTNKQFSDPSICEIVPSTDPADAAKNIGGYVKITGVFENAAPYSAQITIMLQNVRNPTDNRRHKVEATLPTTTNVAAVDESALTEDAADPALKVDAEGAKYKQDAELGDSKWYKLDADGKFVVGDRVDADGDKVSNNDDIKLASGDLKYYKLNADGGFKYIDGFVLETYLDEDQKFIQDSFTQIKD